MMTIILIRGVLDTAGWGLDRDAWFARFHDDDYGNVMGSTVHGVVAELFWRQHKHDEAHEIKSLFRNFPNLDLDDLAGLHSFLRENIGQLDLEIWVRDGFRNPQKRRLTQKDLEERRDKLHGPF